MTTFQLDQCLDSKRFAQECAADGVCGTLRLPPSLRNAADPELLTALMASSHPLVTFDRSLPHEHTRFIPESHPGILIVSNFPAPQTMTIRIAQRVLSRFKREAPNWHEAVWRNSIVELTSLGVELSHVADNRLVPDGYYSFDTLNWSTSFFAVLTQNARRQP